MATPESTRSLRSQRCDFVDLAQSGNYSVVSLPAQKAFCTCPAVHQGHDLRPSLRSCRLHINPLNRLSRPHAFFQRFLDIGGEQVYVCEMNCKSEHVFEFGGFGASLSFWPGRGSGAEEHGSLLFGPVRPTAPQRGSTTELAATCFRKRFLVIMLWACILHASCP